jgi:hypothetical protein
MVETNCQSAPAIGVAFNYDQALDRAMHVFWRSGRPLGLKWTEVERARGNRALSHIRTHIAPHYGAPAA